MPANPRQSSLGYQRWSLALLLLCVAMPRVSVAQTLLSRPPQPGLVLLPPVDEQTKENKPETLELLPAPDEATMTESTWTFPTPAWLAPLSVPRANVGGDGERWIANYRPWIESHIRRQQPVPAMDQIPTTDPPWWDNPVREPSVSAIRVSIDQLVQGALRYSSYVQLVSTQPHIRRTTVLEEEAAFDWRGFLETTYTDTNEPVGNILTTGNNDDRFKDRNWIVNGGVRRDNRLGGNVELSQRLGGQENNSRFLLPNPQATSALELRYTQPLLNGAGCAYNESLIILAQIHANLSSDELVENLQDHLYKVTESYWALYRARAEYLQRLKLVGAAERTLAILEGRVGLDAAQRQIFRARAAVATRQSEIARANTSIRNAESQLRFLVNDPALVHAGGRVFAPEQGPVMQPLPLSMDKSLYTALQHRPDISRGIRDVRAAAVRLGVAEKDVLPKLDLVASTYVAGLAPNTEVANTFGHQFDAGRPSFSLGFLFEVPFGRRAALAQVDRRRWEMQRVFSQFRLTVEEALTKVELAVREVETSYREMLGKYHAMVAVTNEADYLFDRWTALPNTDDAAVLLLENLLDAQERVADEEAGLAQATVDYAMSFVRLKQEMGTLLAITPLGGDVAAQQEGF